MRRCRALLPAVGSASGLVAAAACALGACARLPAAEPAFAPIEVVVTEPASPSAAPPPPAPPPPLPIAEADAGEPELPPAWTHAAREARFDDAAARARRARAAFLASGAPPGDGGSMRAWFDQRTKYAELASRLYASAYFAEDARASDQLSAIAEAAELASGFASSLEVAGLEHIPDDWRTDKALALTFEDIDAGPARRWHDESRALAKRCTEIAKLARIDDAVSRRCVALRAGPRRALVKRGTGGSACPCQPGDPLCSTTGGWCGP